MVTREMDDSEKPQIYDQSRWIASCSDVLVEYHVLLFTPVAVLFPYLNKFHTTSSKLEY